MKLHSILIILLSTMCFACNPQASNEENHLHGQMPNLAGNGSGKLYMVYGNGDSIMYTPFNDSANIFSTPALVGVLPHLAATHARGPQMATTAGGLSVIACNHAGDIFSYSMNAQGQWTPAVKVNDVDTVAKEGLMSLAADGNNVFAVWLDMRTKFNQIYGARSTDGGRSWSKNMLLYASPDTTVCECCKPTIAMKGNNVYVMFRNWLDGNRDMYLLSSTDGGKTFGQPQKLGEGSWALNGCPVDGGGIAVSNNGAVETVWRREGKIYSCQPGGTEKQIGEGKSCTMSAVAGNNFYAWTENGQVVCTLPNGKKETLGPGKLPAIKAVNDKTAVCVWANDGHIQHAMVRL